MHGAHDEDLVAGLEHSVWPLVARYNLLVDRHGHKLVGYLEGLDQFSQCNVIFDFPGLAVHVHLHGGLLWVAKPGANPLSSSRKGIPEEVRSLRRHYPDQVQGVCSQPPWCREHPPDFFPCIKDAKNGAFGSRMA